MISPRTKFTALMLLLGICLIGPMVTPVAMAHTTVKSATLEDGGIYQSLPETFELVFAQKVGSLRQTAKALKWIIRRPSQWRQNSLFRCQT